MALTAEAAQREMAAFSFAGQEMLTCIGNAFDSSFDRAGLERSGLTRVTRIAVSGLDATGVAFGASFNLRYPDGYILHNQDLYLAVRDRVVVALITEARLVEFPRAPAQDILRSMLARTPANRAGIGRPATRV